MLFCAVIPFLTIEKLLLIGLVDASRWIDLACDEVEVFPRRPLRRNDEGDGVVIGRPLGRVGTLSTQPRRSGRGCVAAYCPTLRCRVMVFCVHISLFRSALLELNTVTFYLFKSS